MADLNDILDKAPPRSLAEALADWPARDRYEPSPNDWRDEIFYFLLPDRFSNGQEAPDRLLDIDLSAPEGISRIRALRGAEWRWDKWQFSGANRFQGGTLAGIRSKLDYLADLGITTLWIAPVFRQRIEEDSYHGYGIQNFLDIDPRFGTRRDLVELVHAAHSEQYRMRVVLDVIFNHSGCNWLYDSSSGNAFEPPYLAWASGRATDTAGPLRTPSRNWEKTTTYGPPICRAAIAISGRGKAVSVKATSTTNLRSISEPISKDCASSISLLARRFRRWCLHITTGSPSQTSTDSESTPSSM